MAIEKLGPDPGLILPDQQLAGQVLGKLQDRPETDHKCKKKSCTIVAINGSDTNKLCARHYLQIS